MEKIENFVIDFTDSENENHHVELFGYFSDVKMIYDSILSSYKSMWLKNQYGEHQVDLYTTFVAEFTKDKLSLKNIPLKDNKRKKKKETPTG